MERDLGGKGLQGFPPIGIFYRTKEYVCQYKKEAEDSGNLPRSFRTGCCIFFFHAWNQAVSGLLGFCQEGEKGKNCDGNEPGQKYKGHEPHKVFLAGKQGVTALPLTERKEAPEQHDHKGPAYDEPFQKKMKHTTRRRCAGNE